LLMAGRAISSKICRVVWQWILILHRVHF
jgi:hypothetical protein